MKARRERNLKQIDGRWYIDFTFNGKRHREFGGWTKDQARNTMTKTRAELLDVARGFKKAKGEDVTFEKFADDFLTLYCKENKRSWDRDEISLAHLKAFFKDETLQTIGAESIERFKAARRAEVAPATVNRELACLKTALTKAVEWGRLETNPAARVKKFKEPPARERILTSDEAARLLAAAGPELRPVIITALGTGMRRGEILGLRWADLNFTVGYITLITSKSGKGRKIPMSGAVAAALSAIRRRGEFVFQNMETGRPIREMSAAFNAACALAKITGCRLHDLRHTAASKMVEAGVDLVTVSKILGHASITMTMRYAHPTPETMRGAVMHLGEFMDQVDKKLTASQEFQGKQVDFKSSMGL
ncbi:MAG: tyrosine-type recombinase/integrase [Candidatus Aminicenantales bacterium]